MASDDDLIEAAPCPNCRSPLTVAVSDLGHLVECPGCGTQFRARRSGPESAPPSRTRDADPPPTRRRPRADEEADDRRDRFGEELGERDRPSTRRSRFDDRDYDDGYGDAPRRRGTPGALIAMAVMDFVYAGLLLICGVLGVIGLVFVNQLQAQGNIPQQLNMPLEVALVFAYLGTALVMLFAGVMVLRRKGYGLSVTAMALGALTFVLGLVNGAMNMQNRQAGGGPGPDAERFGMICGFGLLALFWLGYLVTNGILLSKAGRHFR